MEQPTGAALNFARILERLAPNHEVSGIDIHLDSELMFVLGLKLPVHCQNLSQPSCRIRVTELIEEIRGEDYEDQ
jgi:hypothetical protein